MYSKKEDAVYCINCALFSPTDKRRALGSFVNTGYKGWNNIHEKQTLHIGNKYHDDATKEASGIIIKFEKPNNTIPHQTNDSLKERQKTYPKIVEALARIIHLIGKQGIAYRGTEEKADDSDTAGNPGNFLAIVREIANYYPLLHEHVFTPLRKDVSYMSPTSQNELIEIIGKRIIQKKFIEEIKDAQYHSVLADEVTNSNNEILSICIRYVNKEKQIREVFLDFLSLERITGECIGQTILKFYEEKGINILDCRGQCYDGAPNMQSLKKGAASYILKESPKAYTTHCCSHSLNLSLASTCKIPIITNIVEIYKSVLIYFNTSPKRENLLIHIVEQKCFSEERKKVLIGVCQTRWSERDVSYERFYLALPFIVETFEVIKGTHTELDEFEEIYIKGWDAKSKVEATQFLNSLTKFEFVIGMIALYRLLHPVAGITQKLQGLTIDVIEAYQNVNTCIEDILIF